MKILYGVLLCLLISYAATAQSFEIKGVVRDATGSPIPGANVVVKGTVNGTICDMNGGFTLSVKRGDVLSTSFIGYETQEVPVAESTVYSFSLKESSQQLKEVVVIGYGTNERENLTTAVSSVSGKDLAKMPVQSFDQALQGRAAGVQVIKNTGAPGGAVSIRIRGTGSFLGGQEPLYIIDGVPMANTNSGSFTNPGSQAQGNYAGNEVLNGMAGLNPNDIESIDILKDAASASIYGSRAANGVVIITTKRGQSGKPKVNFDTYYGIQSQPKRYELLNSDQFAAMVNEARLRQGRGILFKERPKHNTNWQDEVFRIAPILSTNLSLSGNADKIGYLVSLNYADQQGVIINSANKRVSFRTNLDYKVSDNLKIGLSSSISRSNNNRLRNTGGANTFDTFNNNTAYGPSVLATALVASPAYPVRDDNGGYASDSLTFYPNPVAQAETADLSSIGLLIVSNIYAEVNILKNLKVRSSWSTSIRNEEETFVFAAVPTLPGAGQLQFNYYNELLWNSENYLTYNIDFKEGNRLNVLAGFSLQQFTNRGTNVAISGVTSQNIIDVGGGTVIPTNIFSVPDGDWGMVSYFVRGQGAIKDKYLFEATIRTDGSSRFGPNNKYGFFPAGSIAWKLSSEPFMANVSFVSDAKVRASWGVNGNDQIDPWGWRASVKQLNTQYIGYKPAVPINIDNEDYSWESSEQLDIGLDFKILNDRISITTDYFQKTSKQLLNYVPLPRTTGFESVLRNVGTIRNSGFELAINAEVLRTGNLLWNSSFNISSVKNKVLATYNNGDLASGDFGFGSVARIGQPISFQLYQLEDKVDPTTGRLIVKDISGDGKIDGDDVKIVASPLPKHFGGWTNNFRYNNFDFTTHFTWSYGNYLINGTRGETNQTGKPDLSTIGPNLSAEALDRWTESDKDASFPVINYKPTDRFANWTGNGPTDLNLEDGSYIRLKTLAIGYTIPEEKLKKFKIQNARLYFSTNNLLTLTRYSGYDPEVNANGGIGGLSANIAQGYDSNTYPQSKTYVVGISINL
jgi:TonB-dependent starch-binding outer membrane protein SusC